MGTTDRRRRPMGPSGGATAVPLDKGDKSPPPGTRHRLSHERILACAIGYARRNRLGDLSMRRLGVDLGVEAMSLYRYFPSKAALFEALADALLGQVAAPTADAAGDWPTSVRAYARSLRNVARRCPGLLPLIVRTEGTGPTGASVADAMLAMWRRCGLDEPTARAAQAAVDAFTLGAALSGDCGGSRNASSDARAADDPGRPATPGSRHGDGGFEFALDILVAGLRERLPAARPRHGDERS